MNKKKFVIVTVFIFLAALSRILPHPYNFTPLGAIALFGAAYFSDKKWALLVPLLAMWISDLLLNNFFYSSLYEGFTLFTPVMIWVYGSLILIAFLGMKFLNKVTIPRVLLSAVSASILFFIISAYKKTSISAFHSPQKCSCTRSTLRFLGLRAP